ncbi:helix-turn-helix domain-containing protein [Streptomyces sp. NPDC101118]|uniref:helix-turn-helix domain-containing protein n=1 Tax=Streptomyces sp. NPDC101118 TaxID=3366109 RepID=UPI0037FB5429
MRQEPATAKVQPPPPAHAFRSEAVQERRGLVRQRIRTAGMTVSDILRCEDRPAFVGPGHAASYTVVLVRAGAFLRRVEGEEFFLDPTGGYLISPGHEQRVAHTVGAGDRSTEIVFPERLFADRFDRTAATSRFQISGATDLHHRALLAAAPRGAEPFELAERLHPLLDAVAAAGGRWRADGPGRGPTVRVHGRLVRDTCAALAAGPAALGLSLEEPARLVGTSPHHLSRVFHAVTGTTLTRYRNELRVRGVLHAVGEGADGLRDLAHRYGFADQAHLTRTCRRHTGQVPSAVRRLLADRA